MPRRSISSSPGIASAFQACSGAATALPVGLVSSSVEVISAPDTPSIVQWWTLM